MKTILKAVNRADTAWTTFVMLPAFVLLANAGLHMYQGKASHGEMTGALKTAAVKFSGQYVPPVEAAGAVIMRGVQKSSAVAGNCLGTGKSGPIYLSPDMAGRSNCGLGGRFAQSFTGSIKPYRFN